jgi:hypothetical protein
MKYLSICFLLAIIFLFSNICKAQQVKTEEPKTVVGNLNGNLNVSTSGAAVYNIPLDLPEGRCGMKPSLSLVYNSQQSFGNILGQGWSLTGFSAIVRTNPTPYYNGINDNIDFDEDELMIDGQHLIKIDEGEYRTECDEFSRILFKDGACGKYFQVQTKSGLTMEYGNSVDSRQNYLAKNAEDLPFAWHINRTFDINGNCINYTYNNDPAHGELHPSAISYTDFVGEKQSKSLSHYRTIISFNYDNGLLNDSIRLKAYFEKDGLPFLNMNTCLLQSIGISRDLDGALVPLKDYQISYLTDNGISQESFIDEIKIIVHSGDGHVELPPSKFDWSFYNPQYVYDSDQSFTDSVWAESPTPALALDILGRNKEQDFAICRYKIHPSSPNWYQDTLMMITVHIKEYYSDINILVNGKLHSSQMRAFDWNADGDDELLFVDNEGIKIYDYLNNTMLMVYLIPFNNFDGEIYCADFTGDGINDLITRQQSVCQIYVANLLDDNSIEYITKEDYTYDIQIGEALQTAADFNGDSKQDILTVTSSSNTAKVISITSENHFEVVSETIIPQYWTGTTFYGKNALNDQSAPI